MPGADGYLKIKTKIDNSGVDKDITQLEDKIKKLQTENTNSSKEQTFLQQEIENYNKLTQKADEYNNKIKEINIQKSNLASQFSGNIPDSQTGAINALNLQLESAKQKYTNITNEIDKQSPKIDKVHAKLEKVKQKQIENNAKISEYNQKIEQININKVERGINNVGKSLQSQIGKLGKMAMAVFGIRTAFTAVSRVVNLVKQYNSQVSTDFEYMGYCITNMIAPAVQWLTKLLYTALSYINAIMSAWFGINIFSNSSAKNFQKMKKEASGTAKSAKEIQKSLQGFDEMNVLQDNSSKDAGGSVGTPSMDLSGIQGEVPAWLKWIIDNKDLILSVLGGIAAGILAIRFGLDGIKALGIGIMVAGIIKLIQDLKAYLEDPSWENSGKIIQDIGIILLGLAVIIGSVPLAIGAAIAIIVGLIVSNWEKIKGFLQNGIDWLISKIDWVRDNFGILGETVYKIWIAILEEGLRIFDDLFRGIKNILDGIIKVFKGIFTGDMKMVLEGFKQIFKGIFDSLWGIAKTPLNLIIRGINSLIRGANKIKFDVPDWVPGMGGKQFGFNISEIPLLAKGTVVSRPTPAIIGEAGAEMVMPLENNLEWLDVLANKLASKIGGGSGSVNVYLDGRLIQRQIAKKKEEYDFATNS